MIAVLVVTGQRSVRITRGPFSLAVDGRRTEADALPVHGQLEATVETESEVARAMTIAGYKVGGTVHCFVRRGQGPGSLFSLPVQLPTTDVAEALGIE